MIDVYVGYEGYQSKLTTVKPDQIEPLVESIKQYGMYLGDYGVDELEFHSANYDEFRGGFLIWFEVNT
jgi:hypothetical protein